MSLISYLNIYLALMRHRAMRVAVKQLASTTDISSSRYCNSTPPATDPGPEPDADIM